MAIDVDACAIFGIARQERHIETAVNDRPPRQARLDSRVI
jgi:hypothetical protein